MIKVLDGVIMKNNEKQLKNISKVRQQLYSGEWQE